MNPNPNRVEASAEATAAQAGFRADRALCALLPQLNRRAAKLLFRKGYVRLNGKVANGSERVLPGDRFIFPNPNAAPEANVIDQARAPRLTTPHGRHLVRLYEDDSILVISKPAEIPVHRGQGGFTRRHTLEDVLERAYPPPPDAAPGQQSYYFVHRLDMETSGCLLIAKSDAARDALIRDFSERTIHKEYLAIVAGEVEWKKTICTRPILYIKADEEGKFEERVAGSARVRLRHPFKKFQKKKVMRGQKKGIALEDGSSEGKSAETRFDVVARFKGYTLVRAMPKTGRTHQIRVHLQSLGHPLAYDELYGRVNPVRRRELDLHSTDTEAGEEIVLNRLPLHAWKLRFTHPKTGEEMNFEAKLPRDLREFLKLLKRFRSRS
ncbi:MAG TPA: RluA family pseudouridine synthase [Planctomycetota bacterium]|nr:RluA family pseudouridine synthase [Planctomycetota bacterium]